MNNYSSENEEAHITLLHISNSDEQKLHHLINKLWFFYSVQQISTQTQEEELINKLSSKKPKNLFDILIADLSANSPFKQGQKERLFHLLKEHQRPLISISNENNFICDDSNPQWLHITLPISQISKHALEIKDAITNYWFSVPTN